jgi:hypothetical protein
MQLRGHTQLEQVCSDGSWPGASPSGGPILVGGGDLLQGLYQWNVGMGLLADPEEEQGHWAASLRPAGAVG